ncbi:LPXTG-motif cell wall anchor domain-containing protein/conserved repeat domain-containing protein [Saccharopolyspora flava]|uniref:LPXTG-motif cell wall anchor domain-containing protein/conserved repeat domain-containing protein n=2 Tax=Saccharopolyspora flava TaxID=95161 RepID=A0A1I6RJD3_9PSEU|nr:LPXTG-motif cell wall anchor domain-containing protein/conserved repeat domain-containing protein [Saccharopolyspora flava]
MTCTATYAITQADVDAGTLRNSATATGVPAGETAPIPPTPPSTVELPGELAPGLSVDKTADATELTGPGQPITYSMLVTNTGNAILGQVVAVEGAFDGSGTLSPVECPEGALLPGQQKTCTASYTTTQADVDRGSLTNEVSATGVAPGGRAVEAEPSSVTLRGDFAPVLQIAKSGAPVDLDGDGVTGLGDQVVWTITVSNTGNATASEVTVSDPQAGTVMCERDSLAPGEEMPCTAEPHVVNAEDVAAGEVSNTAVAHGTAPGGAPLESDPASASVPVVDTTPPPSPGPTEPPEQPAPPAPAPPQPGPEPGPQQEPLAQTGQNVTAWSFLAAALLTAGGVIVLTVRRRRIDG